MAIGPILGGAAAAVAVLLSGSASLAGAAVFAGLGSILGWGLEGLFVRPNKGVPAFLTVFALAAGVIAWASLPFSPLGAPAPSADSSEGSTPIVISDPITPPDDTTLTANDSQSEQQQPSAAPAAPAPAPSGYVDDGGYVGYAKNSFNTADSNFYYWHYLTLCVANLTAGNYTLIFSNDGATNYHSTTATLPASGCIRTDQQGGTLTEAGVGSDWFTIEVVGQFTTPQYQPWT